MHVENYKMQMREIKDSPSVECGAWRPAALMDQDIQHSKDATAPWHGGPPRSWTRTFSRAKTPLPPGTEARHTHRPGHSAQERRHCPLARRPATLMDQDIQHRKDATAPKPINRLHTMPIETLVRFFYTDEVTYIIL